MKEIIAEMPGFMNPWKAFRRHQAETDCPGKKSKLSQIGKR